MRTLGVITRDCVANGKKLVDLLIKNEGGINKWERFVLDNEEDIPSGYPDFGVFSYVPEDQFCSWIDIENT